MRAWLFLSALLLCRTSFASAQAASPADQTQLIQTLISRIDQLEKRVAELESAKATAAAASTMGMEAMPIAAQGTPAAETRPTLNIAGFSDINFSATDEAGSRSGFTEGQFILHLNSNLTPKVSFMGELSFTARPDAGLSSPPATG